jgi:hypothetical protein
MKRNSFLAVLLSLIVPGLGQIYCGEEVDTNPEKEISPNALDK